MRRPAALLSVLAAAAALAGAWACREAPQPAEAPPPHVIVYLIDALRADHLGAYGYARPTSPNLDAFAADAVLFLRAYAQASWTRPSVGSLFTGRFPSRHGAVSREHRLDPHVTTLAELLSAHGYASAAFVSNPNVLPIFGFDRGFGEFHDVRSVHSNTNAEEVHSAVFEFLAERPAEPLFLYVHTIDPHAPYKPPMPYLMPFRGIAGAVPQARRPRHRRAVNRYDGEIAYSDAQFGRFLERLRQLGLYEDAIIVVLSDHGEAFGEHDSEFHGYTLFEEQVHVPLIVRFPNGAEGGRRVETPVRVVDLLPTLAESLDIAPPDGIDGTSLLPLLRSDRASAYDPVFYFEQDLDGHILSGIIRGKYKLIGRDAPAEQRGVQLFDLALDPRELRDLASQRPDTTQELLRDLERSDSAAAGGVYLDCVSAESDSRVRTLRGTVEVLAGRLRTWESSRSEGGKGGQLSADGRSARFQLRLHNRENPLPDRPDIVDVGRLRFTTDPPRATFRLRLESPGPEAGHPLRLGASPAPQRLPMPLESNATDPRIVLWGPPTRGVPSVPDAHCHLYSVAEIDHVQVGIDELLEARLRALGYIGEPETP